MTYYRKMFSQNETVFHSEMQHAGTRFIKGSPTHTDSKRASYWNIQQETTLINANRSRAVWILVPP